MARRRKSILIVSELGAGFGHAANQLRLGTALAGRGHAVTCTVPDLVRTGFVLRRAGFPVLQSPAWPGRSGARIGTGYADILARHGFDAAPALMMMVGGWQNLYDIARPDLVIADHSPTAVLAAYGGDIPIALVGNAYLLPPPGLPEFPMLRPDGEPLASQARMLDAVQEVQTHRKRPAPETLPGLFAAAVRGVLSFPELDPYADVRSEPVIGRLEDMPVYVPRSEARSVYAYLAADHPDMRAAATALGRIDAQVTCFIRDDTGAFGPGLKARGVEVLEEPADLTVVLPKASVVVSYASMGIAHSVLSAGRPHVALPIDLEKIVNARALEKLGVSRTIGSGLEANDLVEAIEALLEPGRHADHAAACALSIMARGTSDTASDLVEACEDLMG